MKHVERPSYLIVTRPFPEGKSTYLRLRSMGYKIFWHPLLRCEYLGEEHIIEQLSQGPVYDLLVVTSSRAISGLSAKILDRLISTPVVAVGKKTTSLVESKGFHRVFFGGKNVTELSDYIQCHFAHHRLLHLTRTYVKKDKAYEILPTYLPNHIMTKLVTYMMLPCSLKPLKLLLQKKLPAGILVFSQQSSHLLASCLNSYHQCSFYCLSHRISEPLKKYVPSENIFVSKHPTSQSFMNMVRHMYPPTIKYLDDTFMKHKY